MANARTPLGQGAFKQTLDTSATVKLDMPEERVGSTWLLQVKALGAAPGNFVIKQTIRGSGYSGSDLISCVYTSTAATAATAAGTAVSAGGVILQVIADRMDTYLVYTADTDGMEVICAPSAS